MQNHDTGRILPAESQRNITDPSVVVTNSSAIDYDSADESLVCRTPLPPLKKLDGVEPISGPKTIKSILRSKSTFKAEALKGIIINEPSSSSSASKVHSAPAGKQKSVKIKDDPPLAIVMKELNNLKLRFSKNQPSYSRRNQPQQVPQNALQNKYKTQFKKSFDLTCDHAEYISTMNMSQHLKSLGRASSRSKIPRPSKCFFLPCTHCVRIDHLSNECLYYHICGLCGSYDHDTNGHNRIISLEREINPRNPQHTFKRCEVCGSSTHTTTDHYDIEWFKRGEALQAKKAEDLKSTRAESSNANRSKTPTRRIQLAKYSNKYVDNKCRVTFSEHDSEITKDGKVIASKELVRNLPNALSVNQHFGDACNHWKNKLHDSTTKAKNVVSTTKCLELLHMDLFGPSAVRSYGGNRYTLVIVDDYSRYTWTRFLKNKTEAFDQFEIFSKKIQNQLGCTIVSIRTDHGREFDNEVQFREFCNANGITHNFSAPRTPQSNGVVERKNRTLQEMSRTILNKQSLPQKFWCNTVDTSTYILNQILIRTILGKTPYEILRGRKPTLDYFRVFGSKCFILNTKDYLTKFDPKSYEGVFLGAAPVSDASSWFDSSPSLRCCEKSSFAGCDILELFVVCGSIVSSFSESL
ncbi:retrovirus-related pol polyprotein from transposon TNT 1-94 [Tanacetum coccineum]